MVIPAVNARTGLPVWNLDAPVRLPSGMTVILDGCRVECKGTAFTNSLSDDPESRKIGCEQSDLFLIGRHGGTIRSDGKEPQIFFPMRTNTGSTVSASKAAAGSVSISPATGVSSASGSPARSAASLLRKETAT